MLTAWDLKPSLGFYPHLTNDSRKHVPFHHLSRRSLARALWTHSLHFKHFPLTSNYNKKNRSLQKMLVIAATSSPDVSILSPQLSYYLHNLEFSLCSLSPTPIGYIRFIVRFVRVLNGIEYAEMASTTVIGCTFHSPYALPNLDSS